jgi:hypothetical protein
VGTLKQIFYYITIKRVLVIFHYQNNFQHNSCFLHLCYLVATSTSSKLQLFQPGGEWELLRNLLQCSFHVAHCKKIALTCSVQLT